MSRTKYPIHPDFKRWQKMNPPLGPTILPVTQKLLGLLFKMEKTSAGMRAQKVTIPVKGGETAAILYSPEGIGESSPCLVYYHGGGFVLPAAPYHYSLAREYALRARCRVLFVDYRLAPQHPFPAAPEDCFAAYSWALEHSSQLSIDKRRAAVGGDSAGGELAAVVCLMAKERGLPQPCAQLLIYPVVGRGLETESMKKYTDTPMCNSRDIQRYDELYFQDPSAGRPEYASPIHAPSLAGLPETYIETAEFDCLRDGGVLYAERLREFGVSVELRNTEGTMHGFDIVLTSPIVTECVARRAAFLRRAFGIEAETEPAADVDTSAGDMR